MKKLLTALGIALLATAAHAADAEKGTADTATEIKQPQEATAAVNRPKIQIALLLDSSGSMSGLINQARSYMWQVVSDCALSKKNGIRPEIEVALYSYGHGGKGEGDYMTRLAPLTNDLDLISEKLFVIQTDGSAEYCGKAIQRAVDELEWSKDNNSLKMIFIAGNEPFTQGPVKYQDACKNAIAKGITVNTILCGNEPSDDWRNGAKLADGDFFILDHNAAIAQVATPFDKEIAELNTTFNNTYVAYGGDHADVSLERQTKQDSAAKSLNSVASNSRMSMKLNKDAYRNDSWDIIDASEKKDFDLAKIKVEELPEAMRKMTLEERKEYIVKKKAEREEVRKKLSDLVKKQEAYIVEERKKTSTSSDDLGNMMINTTRKQAINKGMTYDKKEK